MEVLTFGIHVAEVAVDVETGEVTVDRIAAIHDIGRVINPLGATSQVEGGIIQGIGHTLSEERLIDPATGTILTRTLDAYRLPTIADVPEIVCEFVDVPDAQLTNLGAKGLGEPPIVPVAAAIANAIRDATGADVRSLPITREEMLKALREARERARAHVELLRPSSLDALDARAAARLPLAGGTEVVPLLRDGLLEADALVDVLDAAAARDRRHADRRGDDAGRARGRRRHPRRAARGRAPRRLAAAPEHGHRRRQPAPVDALLVLAARSMPCRLHGGDTLPRGGRRAPRARDLRQRLLRVGAPVRPRGGAASRSARRCGRTGASCRSPSSTACRPRTTAARRRSSRAS